MYRFPDPLDEAALKGLIADKRFQDPRHPEHGFFKTFVAKAFELVHPDGPRDAAGRAVIDPRDPPTPQVVRGGEIFAPNKTVEREPKKTGVERLGAFQSINRRTDNLEERKSGISDFFPQATPIAPLTWPVKGREIRNDDRGEARFGASRTGASGKPHSHEGLDVVAPAGEAVVSPVSGRIVREFPVYDDKEGKMRGIAIARDDGDISRVLYVKTAPNIKIGARVKAGDLIGHAQDIAGYHAKPGRPPMQNHIHIEIWRRKDGANKQPVSFDRKERERDYEPRDPWQPLHQTNE